MVSRVIYKDRFDEVIIGSGISAYGYLLGSNYDRNKAHKKKVMIASGGFANHEWFNKKNKLWRLNDFRLPSIRAFGVGGTSKLWHGVFFVPNINDAYENVYFGNVNSFDFMYESIKSMTESFTHKKTPLLTQRFENLLSIMRENKIDSSKNRKVLIPKKQQNYTQIINEEVKCKNINFSDLIVLNIEENADGWVVFGIDQAGFVNIFSKRIILAAGALSSLKLISSAPVSFADHSHCFCGLVDSKKLLKVFSNRSIQLKDDVCKPFWKTELNVFNNQVEVSLSFRKVSSFSFSNSFSDFVTFNSYNKWKKIKTVLKNPLEALSLISYRLGYNLPFGNFIVHATVSTRESAGEIRENTIDYMPNKELIAQAANLALQEFYVEHNLDLCEDCRVFEVDLIKDVIMSGAQFLSDKDSYLKVSTFANEYKDTALVVDTAGFATTSVHNQGLLSLLTSYQLAREFNA